jgi:hypothetical protein
MILGSVTEEHVDITASQLKAGFQMSLLMLMLLKASCILSTTCHRGFDSLKKTATIHGSRLKVKLKFVKTELWL